MDKPKKKTSVKKVKNGTVISNGKYSQKTSRENQELLDMVDESKLGSGAIISKESEKEK